MASSFGRTGTSTKAPKSTGVAIPRFTRRWPCFWMAAKKVTSKVPRAPRNSASSSCLSCHAKVSGGSNA
eukprot:7238830-Lingulodinium_polyedra.AAC.1